MHAVLVAKFCALRQVPPGKKRHAGKRHRLLSKMSAEDVRALGAVLKLPESESSDSDGSDCNSDDECSADLYVALLILTKLVRVPGCARARLPVHGGAIL